RPQRRSARARSPPDPAGSRGSKPRASDGERARSRPKRRERTVGLDPVDRVAHRTDHRRGLARFEAGDGRVGHDFVKPRVERLWVVYVVFKDLDHVFAHRHALAGGLRTDPPLEPDGHPADLEVDLLFTSHRTKYACTSACVQALRERTSAKRSRYVSTTRGQVYVRATNDWPASPSRKASCGRPMSMSEISAYSAALRYPR